MTDLYKRGLNVLFTFVQLSNFKLQKINDATNKTEIDEIYCQAPLNVFRSYLCILYLKFIRIGINVNTCDSPSYQSVVPLFAPYAGAEGRRTTLLGDNRCRNLGEFQLGKNLCNREQRHTSPLHHADGSYSGKAKATRDSTTHELRTGPVSYGTDQ